MATFSWGATPAEWQAGDRQRPTFKATSPRAVRLAATFLGICLVASGCSSGSSRSSGSAGSAGSSGPSKAGPSSDQAATGSGSASPASGPLTPYTGPAVTLNFVNAEPQGAFTPLISAFEKLYPKIKVNSQAVPFANEDTSITSRVGAKDPSLDIFFADEPRIAAYSARGYLADLSDLGKEAVGKVDPTALKATQYNNKQTALPIWTSTQLLFFNKRLLTKAGVPLPSSAPQSPMTWESVAAAAKTAQQKGGAKSGFSFDQVDRYYQLQPLPESLGGGSGLTGPGNLTPDVTNAAWVKAFTWYSDLFKKGVSPRGVPPEQTQALFSSGSTAFFAGGPWNAPAFNTAKVDYGVAPYPIFAGGKAATSSGSWSIGLSPFSKNPSAAKLFIAFMALNPNGAWLATEGGSNIPVQQMALKKYLTTVAARNATGPKLAAIIKAGASTAVLRPSSVGYVDFETLTNQAFADIRNGADPTARLKTLNGALVRAFAKYK